MKVLVTGFTFRTIDNFVPVLDELERQGDEIQLMLFPNEADDDAKKLHRLRYRRALEYPIQHTVERHLPFPDLKTMVYDTVKKVEPDIILCDDMSTFPSRAIKKALIESGQADIPLVVFQHGFEQEWVKYNDYFACDYFFAFGLGHKNRFRKALHPRVFATGLPKLERLRNITPYDGQYILFIAQRTPDACLLKEGFEALSMKLRMPIYIKPHPYYHFYYQEMASPRLQLMNAEQDIVPLIAGANFVITPGSTSSMEALWLKKPVVIIPSQVSGEFDQELFVTKDYSADEIIRVVRQYDEKRTEIEHYFNRYTGGREFQSVATCVDIIRRIVANKPYPIAA